MMAYKGRFRLKGVPFLGFSYGRGFTDVEAYERAGKFVILVSKKAQMD